MMNRDYEYDVIEPLSENFRYIAKFINSKEEYKVAFDNLGKELSSQGVDIMARINAFSTKEESLAWIKINLHISI